MAKKRGPKIPKPPAGPKFENAPEAVLTLAARLIDQNHGRLAEAKISYIMRNGTWKKKGEIVDADVSVIAGANRFEMDKHFRILINADVWANADDKIKAYILDKQLSRCVKEETANGDVKWSTRDYYLKEFPSLIERHGLITAELQQLDRVIKQTSAPAEEEPNEFLD
ncbi:putative metallopeptidase [Anaerospora hongkongensis]|uniref:putative metallopeptidase n=1 Tax=Anaerospora hongkongensis TaxID=244830 RepID=UPI00289A8718|nr:putative metallopeptidase [Anaerospora hongkongensis]